jgi:lactoylglutathione lyase
MVSAITLIVLRCRDLAASKRFYEALGLSFVAERHGGGPDHWSCVVGDLVFELYPAGQGAATATRLGFRVRDVASAAQAAVRAGGGPSARGQRAGRAVVLDPDGNAVELCDDDDRPERRRE